MAEIEVEFGGDRPKDPPKSMVDGTLSAYKSSLGFEAVITSTGTLILPFLNVSIH